MSLYRIPMRRFTTISGEIDASAVASAAQAAFQARKYLTLADAQAAFQRAAEHEQWDISDKIARNAQWDAELQAEEARAQRLAAEKTEDQIRFEIARRAFGSFTTTLEGQDEAVWHRALAVKMERGKFTAAAKHRLTMRELV